MSNTPKNQIDDSDFGLEDEDDVYDVEPVIRRCRCSYKGALELDANGFVCANCGYLLIERRK
jgi:hypothetical protein